MAVTKKRFFMSTTVVYILIFAGNAGLHYYRWHTIDWVDHLVYAFFFVGFLTLFGWLFGDITFKKKGDTK